jgi:ATP-binding cassette subfamily B protein
LNLVPRFFDPTAGRMAIDGHDVRDLDIDELRRRIGFVFQESFLFRRTVHENIALGRPEASRSLVVAAARLAAADRFIEILPAGYDTVAAEGGVTLSGGERQRLAIARALAVEPAVLLLDDATSAIDPATEREIVGALRRSSPGRTTLWATHRPSVLEVCHWVVLLDTGTVVDRGTHDELLSRHGPYYSRESRARPFIASARMSRVGEVVE